MYRITKSWTTTALVVTLVGSIQAGMASAALLTGTSTPNVGEHDTTDITAAGTLDWAIWDINSSTNVTSMAPTNLKSGSPGVISNLAPGGDETTIRGISSGLFHHYSYSDGASPIAETDVRFDGVINSSTGVANTGMSFTVKGNAASPYVVTVYATVGQGATGSITASLAGATDVTMLSGTMERQLQQFTFTFQPDDVNDLLTVTYVNTTAAGYAFVSIQGIAVSGTAAPEPASAALWGLVGLGLLVKRRH